MDFWWVFGGFKHLKHLFSTPIEEILGLTSPFSMVFSHSITMVFELFSFLSFFFLVDFGIVEESFHGFSFPF